MAVMTEIMFRTVLSILTIYVSARVTMSAISFAYSKFFSPAATGLQVMATTIVNKKA